MTEISCRDDDPRIAGHRRACNFAQPFSRHRIVGELARQRKIERVTNVLKPPLRAIGEKRQQEVEDLQIQ